MKLLIETSLKMISQATSKPCNKKKLWLETSLKTASCQVTSKLYKNEAMARDIPEQ